MAAGNPVAHWRLLADPACLIAFGFGSGLAPRAPGTFGTLFAWLTFIAGSRLLGGAAPAFWLWFAPAALVVGTVAAHRAGVRLGVHDSAHIVIDEVVAFWFVLMLLPEGPHAFVWQAGGFALFRLFDIVKPPPIDWLDRHVHGGIGVMLDDLLAALYALIVVAVVYRLRGWL